MQALNRRLIEILKNNLFPTEIIDKCINNYLTNALTSKPSIQDKNDEIRYYKIPFIGNFFILTQKKLDKLVKQHCSRLKIKLAFTTFKVGSLFIVKDPS